MTAVRFDHTYYQRFYLDPNTRVYDREKQWRLVQAVACWCEWFGVRLDRVLDAGSGVGWWRDWIRENRPDAEVVSTELEPEICAKFGHLQADLRTWRAERTFDLVICQGVLPYLDDAGAKAAIKNLTAMCHGVLYLEAITKRDLKGSVDLTLTDARIHRRTGNWYRKLLAPGFVQVGAGLWAKRDAELVLYELEAPPEARRK